jgi:SAM-dependent methyltransferase
MGILPTRTRSAQIELLDAPNIDHDALVDNLRDLRKVDRYLGGAALTWRYLLPMLRRLPHGAAPTLLDIATGGADGPRRLAALAQRHGYALRLIASDRLIDVLRYARAHGDDLALVRHDALALPFRTGAVDFVTCSLALHHFDHDAAVGLLREMNRVARRGLIVNDLRRSLPAYWGARLLALGPWHAMARHDGPLSVLRAYTPAETRSLAAEAGIAQAQIEQQPLFRMIVALNKA